MASYLKNKLKLIQERREDMRENIPARMKSICKSYEAESERSRCLNEREEKENYMR